MPQAISLQEQNGRDNIRQLCFDQLAERIENRRQRITFGDHLENAFLSGQQSFSPLSIFNVGQSSIPLQDFFLFISQRYGTSQEPTVVPVRVAMPRFVFKRLAGRPGDSPLC